MIILRSMGKEVRCKIPNVGLRNLLKEVCPYAEAWEELPEELEPGHYTVYVRYRNRQKPFYFEALMEKKGKSNVRPDPEPAEDL